LTQRPYNNKLKQGWKIGTTKFSFFWGGGLKKSLKPQNFVFSVFLFVEQFNTGNISFHNL